MVLIHGKENDMVKLINRKEGKQMRSEILKIIPIGVVL